MKEIAVSLAVSALVIGFALFAGVGGITPLFALALLALSQVGFFALQALHKSGITTPAAEYIFVMMVFVCFAAAALAFNALSALVPLAFIPIIFCAPAVASFVKGYFS